MAEWLRPVFARSKPPLQLPSILSTDALTGFLVDDCTDSEESMSRFRPSPRVSSYVGLHPSSPRVSTPDTFPNIRAPENLYQKPSSDQLALTLKVVMMNQSSMNPVPVQYNACILHVLEAYQDLHEQLDAKEQVIKDLKQSNAKDIKDFERIATLWALRDQDNRAKLKKLEVLLSGTKTGMEALSEARPNSLTHTSREAALDAAQDCHRELNRRDRDQELADFDDPERQQLKQQFTVDCTSSTGSNRTLNMNSFIEELSAHKNSAALQGRLCEKPLPDIPTSPAAAFDDKTEYTATYVEFGPGSGENPIPPQMGFSFLPGDDMDILTQAESRNRARTADEQIYQKPSTWTAARSNTSSDDHTFDQNGSTSLHKLRSPNTKSKPRTSVQGKASLQSKTSPQRRDQPDSEPLKRDDSTSSVITAVRDNSGKSSAGGVRNNSGAGQQLKKLQRNTANSEAVTAAVRAIAARKKNSPRRRQPDSGSNEERSGGEKASQLDVGTGEDTSRSGGSGPRQL